MLLCAFFNSLPNILDIVTNFPRNYNKLVFCRQSFIGGNKLVKMVTMYWKLPSWEMVSDRKTTGSLHISYRGTLSLSSFSHYISLVLFRGRVCYFVIAESLRQIYEIYFFYQREKAGIWLSAGLIRGTCIMHMHWQKQRFPFPTTMLTLQIVKMFPR